MNVSVLICVLLNCSVIFAYEIRDCGPEDRTIQFHNFDFLKADPLVIGKNDPIVLTFNATQVKPFPENTTMKVQINRIVQVFGFKNKIPLPCINGFGSCDQSFCSIFNFYSELVCKIFDAAGVECTCPTLTKHYLATNVSHAFDLSTFPPLLLNIGSGQYEIELLFKDENKQLACLQMDLKVKLEK